ncbi:hypothetical protein L210DRAFT_3522892 [Boletus edulis BED1]|uniref:Uncharacterized protein n=1 Tax=Boletus edulis BED1 TaxID=1328754 RepID=A0AAD4GK00_BOLED|nr:hypothetical protein L210DRAFT_3522892 [Boletus edulis BED1]
MRLVNRFTGGKRNRGPGKRCGSVFLSMPSPRRRGGCIDECLGLGPLVDRQETQ